MDIALALDRLLPSAEYGGSLTENTQEAYDALVWNDVRPKPTWVSIQALEQALTDEMAKAAGKVAANNQATLIMAELFVDLIEALLANTTIAATDFPLETRQEYQQLKTLIDNWRALP